MQKIILYYKFAPVLDPQMAMNWQRELCTRLNLRGRIIVSAHGINGTLGGDIDDVRRYCRAMNDTETFRGIEYKWSDGSREDFPRLSVKVRKELVTLAPGEEFDVFNQGKGLRPKEWHEYLEAHPDVTVLDGRNAYESDIGKFEGAITPNIQNFRDIKETLEKLPKDKPILTYCTGDIRCEYLSAYMRHSGFSEVYHLDGGIVKYGEEFKEKGKWQGQCYVFDKRKHVKFGETADIGVCVGCGTNSSAQVDCSSVDCRHQYVLCTDCQGASTIRECPSCGSGARVR